MSTAANIKRFIRPAILISEVFHPWLSEKGVVADAIGRVADDGFYSAVEVANIPDPNERMRVGEIVRSHALDLTCWMSFVLVQNGLNLSSIDTALRERSVRRIIDEIEPAVECGAKVMALLSGPDPGVALRAKATEQLICSIREIWDGIVQSGAELTLALEPLDRGAHKNALIGPTAEFIDLARRVREFCPSFGVSWDSAHVTLCEDDLLTSLRQSCPIVTQIHLANAVTDRGSELYGDFHMPLGAPGFLDVSVIADIFRIIAQEQAFAGYRPLVSVEIRTSSTQDPWQVEEEGRLAIVAAWEELHK